MNRGGFSWKKLLGISAAKSRISHKIGIPLSRSGRNQKIGRIIISHGCLLVLLIPAIIIISSLRKYFLKDK